MQYKQFLLTMQYKQSTECKQLILIVRAINYHVGKQNFTVVFMMDLKSLNVVADLLSDAGNSIQMAVCGLTPRQKGIDFSIIAAVIL